MQQFFDMAELQKVQDYFCTLTHIFGYCVDDQGNRLTQMTGDKRYLKQIMEVISEDDFYQLYRRVSESGLEDIVVDDTDYDNVKIAAVYVKDENWQNNCWLICCVLNDVTEGNLFHSDIEGIPEQNFYHALDLLAEVESKMLRASAALFNAQAESSRSRYSETEMSHALKRTEAITEIVQYLESKESFEDMAQKILNIAGEYLGVSGIILFQVCRNQNYVDMIAHYDKEGLYSQFPQDRNMERDELLWSDKPQIISTGTLVSAGVRGCMTKYRMKALATIPIFVNQKLVMYFCVKEQEEERIWQLEDIKFMNDVAKILQSILARRVQKNSLASSYASLQEILDNVGTCIYVKDIETEECLFANQLMKSIFEVELKHGTLNTLLKEARPLALKEGFYELNHKEKGKFYDLHQTQMSWVDGRKVCLFALYDITDKKIYQKKIEQQAYTDFLTGLYNRMCCERDLAAQIDKTKQEKTHGGLLYMDLDDFKHINDGLGHQYGDVLLQSISHAFLRIKGISETCYRMGGDEFVIIIPPESYDQMETIVDDIRAVFAKPWFLKDADYYCTMSMGICNFPDDGENVADLIKKADIAMYEAKKSGKNRVARYSSGLGGGSNKRLDMEKNMRDATSGNYSEFKVYFQPIIDIQKPRTPCAGAEALVRWNSAALGFIPPSDFIPLAEYLGLITPIGNYVLREACYACKKWNDNGHPEYKVNVNLSVVQLLQSDIREVVHKALHDTGINPRNLTLEVTESLAINDMDRMKEILNSIRELGVRIALDDFGTGYSSLNHIREIPLDVIKVDQSFVSDLADDEYSQSFIKMVGELASAIGVSICVEGIETKEQYKVLEGMKVRLVQGYYFDKPLSRDKFEDKYVN